MCEGRKRIAVQCEVHAAQASGSPRALQNRFFYACRDGVKEGGARDAHGTGTGTKRREAPLEYYLGHLRNKEANERL